MQKEINSIEDMINLSDEEFSQINTDFSDMPAEEDESTEESALNSEEDGTEEESESTEEEQTEEEAESEESDENEEETDESEEDDNDSEDESDTKADTDTDTSFSENETDLINKILKNPIRANNRDIQVKDADEAVRLIQMGFGMQEKARKLKPHMRHIKTLEKANLLDDDKINFSIDLLNGDKNAILQLLKDNNIDPLDLESDNPESNYKPTNHSVTNEHVQFEEQLDLIKASPKSQDTINYIGGLDDVSFDMVKQDPNTISVINQLMEQGHHDKIIAAKDKAELLRDPLISGKSDLEAYLLIGAKLDREGAFSTDPAQSRQQAPVKSTSTQNNRRKADIKSKKAASTNSGQSSSSTKGKQEVDIDKLANLSDEEFLKQFG